MALDVLRRLAKLEATHAAAQRATELTPAQVASWDRLAQRVREGIPEPTFEQKATMRQANAAALHAARAVGGFDPYVFLDEYEKARGDIGLCRSIGHDGITQAELGAIIKTMIECGPGPPAIDPIGAGNFVKASYCEFREYMATKAAAKHGRAALGPIS